MEQLVETVEVKEGLKLVLLDREKIQEIYDDSSLVDTVRVYKLLEYQIVAGDLLNLTGTPGTNGFTGFCCVDEWQEVDGDFIRIVGSVYYDTLPNLTKMLLDTGTATLYKRRSPVLFLEYDGLTNEEGELY